MVHLAETWWNIWNLWIKTTENNERLFVLCTGSALLVQAPKFWSSALNLGRRPMRNMEDLTQSLEALNCSPASQYLFETFMRGINLDLLRHALFAALLSCTLSNLVPLPDLRERYLDATKSVWDKLAEKLMLTTPDAHGSALAVTLAQFHVAGMLAPLLNTWTACYTGGLCVSWALTQKLEGPIVTVLPVCGMLYQCYPTVNRFVQLLLGRPHSDDEPIPKTIFSEDWRIGDAEQFPDGSEESEDLPAIAENPEEEVLSAQQLKYVNEKLIHGPASSA